MKTVNFAILGCGNIGSRHTERIKEIEGANLQAVCDIAEDKAKSLGEKYGCSYYFKLEDMLKNPNIDFVNVCTPCGLHARQSIAALKAGKNVLSEKPMAIFAKDALQMVQVAGENKRKLFIVKQNRYNPPIKLVRQLATDGKLGEPILFIANMIWNRNEEYYQKSPWRRSLKMAGGTLYNQASHFVDLMLSFMGKPENVYALMGTKKMDIEIEDTGTITSEFENGSFGVLNYTVTATNRNYEGSITLISSKGTIKIGGEYLDKIDYFQVEGIDSFDSIEAPTNPDVYGFFQESMSKLILDVVKNFNDPSYVGDLVTGQEAIGGVRLMEGAMESAKTKKIVNISLKRIQE